MPRGILETIGLAGSVMLAAPVALFGAQDLLAGTLVRGTAFLVLAALMIVVPRVVTTPDDVAAGAAERVVGRVVEVDEEKEG